MISAENIMYTFRQKRVLNVLFFSAPGRASDAHLWLITIGKMSNQGI